MKKKSTFVFLLALVMIFAFAASAMAADYSDTENHWASAQIEKWSDAGILQGSDGQFRPSDSITRGEMAIILDRIMDYQVKATNSFGDLASEAYFTDAILKANASGVILGDAGKVRPKDYITREEAAVMLGRAFGLTVSANANSTFTDKANIASWASAMVLTMEQKGFIGGTDGKFLPKNNISRAEVVKIVDNIVKGFVTKAGTYTADVAGTLVVNTPNVILQGITISGDLVIAAGVGEGEVTLDNVTVKGNVVVKGGGVNSIVIKGNSNIGKIFVTKVGSEVRVVAEGGAEVDVVVVDDGSDDVVLTGSFGDIQVTASDIVVNAVSAVITTAKIDGENSKVLLDSKSTVTTLTLSAEGAQVSGDKGAVIKTVVAESTATGAEITGAVSVQKAEVQANNVVVDTVGTKVSVSTGVTGTTSNGNTINSGATVTTTTTAPNTSTGSGGGNTSPVIATVSTIAVGAVNPTVVVTLANDTFTADGVSTLITNWTSSAGTTGFVGGTITRNSDTQITFQLTGTAKAGTLTLQADAESLTKAVASNTVTVTITPDISAIPIAYDAPNPSTVISVAGDTFTAAAETISNWTVNAGTTGLTVSNIDLQDVAGTATGVTIDCTGTSAAGTLTIRANAAALTSGLASDTASIVITQPTLESIAITAAASKTTYKVGESLDITDMVVTGTYSDASTHVETITVANVTGFDSSAVAASQTLTVTVGGKTTTYTIAIGKADGLALTGVTADNTTNTVSGMTAAMEFSTNGTDWTLYNATTPNLPDLTDTVALQVRFAATATHTAGPATTFNFTPTAVMATASALTTATGATTITLGQAITGLATGDIVVKKDATTLTDVTDYALSGLDTAAPVITFTANAALDNTSVVTVTISKHGYTVNGAAAISVANHIPGIVSIAAIGGVTAPVTGATPVAAITGTVQYTGTVNWSPVPATFAGGTVYAATITLTPEAGFTLTGVGENFFTVAGATATNAANSGVITAVFPITAGITSVTVTPETATVAQGGTIQLTETVVAVGGAAQTVNWTSSDGANKVTVDAGGLVTVAADAATGDYTITATSTVDNTKTDTATITVVNPSIAVANDGGITEGAESGEVLTVTLTGDTFVEGQINTTNITVADLPTGVTVGSVAYTDPTHIAITLSGNSTADYDTNVTATVTVKPAALTLGGVNETATIGFVAIVEAQLAAPTVPVVDDAANTFGWTNNATQTNATDYEYSTDSGVTWTTCTANPQTGITGTYAAGVVQVRAKATLREPAGVALVSANEFTTAVTASASALETATGATTITLGQAITGLATGDIVVKKDATTLTDVTDYTLSGLATANPVVTFTANAGLITENAITVTITKAGYTINGGNAISVANTIVNPDVQLTTLTENVTAAFDPVFAGGTYVYALAATNAEASVGITPTLAGATITWDVDTDANPAAAVNSGETSTIPLVVGANTITLHVAKTGTIAKDYVITVTRAPDTTPADANSGITGQTQGALDSKQVTLTITVKNAASENLTGLLATDFTVKIDGAAAVDFTNAAFAGFADNANGTYTVTYTGATNHTSFAFTDLTAKSVVIEAGPIGVVTPHGESPVLSSVTASADGTIITLAFDKTMAPPASSSEECFSAVVNGEARTFSAAALNADNTKIDLTLSGALVITSGVAVTLSYSGAFIQSLDFGLLQDFTNVAVTNGSTVALVSFTGITANGANGTETTTELTLNFNAEPTGLTADNITLTGATKGALSGSGNSRTLAISNITVANGENVTVALTNPTGVSITTPSKTVAVYKDATAPILSLTSASGTTHNATTLNFTSDEAGTYYYLVLAAADGAPDAATIKLQGTAVAKGTAAAVAAANTANVSGLTASTAYKAYVIVEDGAATPNVSGVATIEFSTTAAPDTTAPASPTYLPAADASGVTISVTPTLTFAEALYSDVIATSMGGAPTGIIKVYEGTNSSGVALTEGAGADNQHFTVGYDSENKRFTVTFGAALKNNQAYYVELQANTVYDALGNGISAAQGVTFTTGAFSNDATLDFTAETGTKLAGVVLSQESGGGDGSTVGASIWLSVIIAGANAATAVFEPVTDNAIVTAYADNGAGGGTYLPLAASYDFSGANAGFWIKVVSEDGSQTLYYYVVVSVV